MRLAHSLSTISILGFALGCAEGSPTSTFEAPADEANLATSRPTASATGGLHWTIPPSAFGFPVDNRLTIAALRSDEEVKGRFVYEQAYLGNTFLFKGPVTCLGVYDGFRAKLGGRVEQSNDPDVPVGTFIWWHVHDNGEGSAAPPDQATLPGLGNESANEAFCASANLPVGTLWNAEGNVQVRGLAVP